jgi:hypothetical protein
VQAHVELCGWRQLECRRGKFTCVGPDEVRELASCFARNDPQIGKLRRGPAIESEKLVVNIAALGIHNKRMIAAHAEGVRLVGEA